jgi:hypothetical protein
MTGGIMRVGVEAVELRGPGMLNWAAALPVLAGGQPYRAAPIVLEPPAQLSTAERRRAIPSVKLALAVGAAAVEQSGLDPATLPAVFASSGADGETISAILAALVTPAREVSPTRFHNSVHNAPSGYWGIAMQSRAAATSLSSYDASFAVGLLEACVQAVSADRPILLVAYDLPYPEPLNSARRIEASFGAALVLSPAPSHRSLAELTIRVAETAGEATACADRDLEALRRGTPAARCLPLLAMLAAGSAGSVRLDLSHGALEVSVAPPGAPDHDAVAPPGAPDHDAVAPPGAPDHDAVAPPGAPDHEAVAPPGALNDAGCVRSGKPDAGVVRRGVSDVDVAPRGASDAGRLPC